MNIVPRLERHEAWLILILVILILRIPNFFEPYWYGDEGIYLAVGQALRKGARLYTDIIDHKTPLIYWITAIGGTLTWLKVVLLAASLTSVTYFYLLLNRLFGRKRAAFGTILFGLFTTLPPLEGNIANGELLLMPMVLAGVWLFFEHWPHQLTQRSFATFLMELSTSRLFLIGFLFGGALLLKVPAGFDFGALGIFLLTLWPYVRTRKGFEFYIRTGVLLLLGFLGAIVLSIGYFYLVGSLQDYLNFGLLYNFRYIQAWNPPFSHPVLLFFSSLLGRGLLLTIYLALIIGFRKRIPLLLRFGLIWFGMTFIAALLSLRPYPHYLIQALPPLFFVLAQTTFKRKAFILPVTAMLIAATVVLLALQFKPYPLLAYYKNFIQFATQQISAEEYNRRFDQKTPETYTVAAWLASRSESSDRIFIWGDEPMVYALADRQPAGRFTVAFHISSFGAYEETLEAIRTQKPRYILDYYQRTDSFPELYKTLHEDYDFMTTLGRANIYRRLPDSK